MYGVQHIKEVLTLSDSVRMVDDEKLLAQLSVYLKYVFNDLGQVPHEEDTAYLKSQLIPLIRNKYPHLKLPEIGMAFRNGIQKKYGEYYGVNLVSCSMFLEAYNASDERCEAVKRANTETNAARLLEPSVAEFDGEAWVAKLYAEYLEKGACVDHGNLAYDYLSRSGKIDLSPEEKQTIWGEAQKQCREQLEAEKKTSNNFYTFKEAEKKLIQVLENARSPMVVVKSKQLALIEHFKKQTI